MNRALYIIGFSILLAACSRPTDRGQQYIDGPFKKVLNPVTQLLSDKPNDHSLFSAQLHKVETLSPSLSSPNKPLYDSVKTWLAESGDPIKLASYGISLEQMGGADGFGNVLFTGYFSPVIKMRRQADATFRYPLYAMPSCEEKCPTRTEIYQGSLSGLGLELGYSASLIDNFIMEVQGSGFIQFDDLETLEYFAFGGKNGHPYVSIGRVLIDQGEISAEKMSLQAIQDWVKINDPARVLDVLQQNPSYVFFEPKAQHPVMGSAGIPLLAGAAVAADRKYLPMGSVLLAEVPQLDNAGNWNGKHILKLLIALDTGGAVKKNHLDLYHGIGEKAGVSAGHHKHFGRVWKLGNTASLTQQELTQQEQKKQRVPNGSS